VFAISYGFAVLRGGGDREPLIITGRNVQIGTQIAIFLREGRILPSRFLVGLFPVPR